MKALTASSFFGLIWPSQLLTNETLELRVIDRNTQKIRREFASSVDDFLAKAQKHKDYEVYFGVSTRLGDSGGKKHNCYRVRTIWADLDNKKVEECQFPFSPSVVVDSGGGSHAYWVLSSPILVRDDRWRQIEAFNRGICRKYKGDIAAIDVTRVLRVPSFYNHKYAPPRLVKAFTVNGEIATYNLEDFRRAGFFDDKPGDTEVTQINPGKNVAASLPEKTRRMLETTGGISYGGDFSRQDSVAIVSILAAGFKPADAYATFAASARGKHASQRKEGHFEDYLTRTIHKARSYLTAKGEKLKEDRDPEPKTEQTPTPSIDSVSIDFSKKRDQPDGQRQGIVVDMANNLETEKARWVWPDYIPAAKITILAGDPGMGKSTIAIDLVSRISRGTFLPCGEERTVLGSCLIASAEDAPEDTINPRLIASEANLERIGIIREVRIDEDLHYLSFPRDLERLKKAIIRKCARLVIIDPLNAFLERGVDTYKDQDIRSVLAPLEAIAEETGASILIVAHLNKKEDANTLYRVGGSIGFIGAARSVLAVTTAQTKDKTRVLYSLKSNLSVRPPSLAYETQQIRRERKKDTDWKGDASVVSSRIKWRGAIDFDPTNSAAADKDTASGEVESFLRQVLSEDSEVCCDDIFQEAKSAGITKGQLTRLKPALDIKATKKRDGKWYWAWTKR